jgi:hypothetical protein
VARVVADARRAALAVAVALPFLLGAAAGAPDPTGTPVLRFGDPDIVESSGLAFTATTRGGLVHTVNDSGDSGRVFTVDTATGSTVGVTSWDGDPVDVEALAPSVRGTGPSPRRRTSSSTPTGHGTPRRCSPTR